MMRYIVGVLGIMLIVGALSTASSACELRGKIRQELRDKMANMDIDLKGIEDDIHAAIHEEVDGEKERIKEEIRRLKEERREIARERRRAGRGNDDDNDSDDWNTSAMMALGLYGLGAFLLFKRPRKNME